MTRPSEDDREAVERAFADLVAGYHLTSDRPDPLLEQQAARDQASDAVPPSRGPAQPAWSDQPLFQFEPPRPVHKARSVDGADEAAPIEEEPAEEELAEEELGDGRFVPEPPLPLPRPAWPVLIAWIAMGYAVLAVLAVALGLQLPRWAGWLAVAGFVGGFGLLVTRLPRHRPPDAGNGAVV